MFPTFDRCRHTGKVVIRNGRKIKRDLNHQDLPDPVADRFRALEQQIFELQAELEDKKKGSTKMTITLYNTLTRKRNIRSS